MYAKRLIAAWLATALDAAPSAARAPRLDDTPTEAELAERVARYAERPDVRARWAADRELIDDLHRAHPDAA